MGGDLCPSPWGLLEGKDWWHTRCLCSQQQPISSHPTPVPESNWGAWLEGPRRHWQWTSFVDQCGVLAVVASMFHDSWGLQGLCRTDLCYFDNTPASNSLCNSSQPKLTNRIEQNQIQAKCCRTAITELEFISKLTTYSSYHLLFYTQWSPGSVYFSVLWGLLYMHDSLHTEHSRARV